MAEDQKKEVDLDGYPDEESKKIGEEMEERMKEKSASKKETEEGKESKKPEPPPKKETDKQDKGKKEKDEEKDEEEEEEEEEKEEEEEPEKPEKTKRKPTLMPIYKHRLAESKWKERENELLGEIEKIKSQKPAQTSEEFDKKIQGLADKSGLDADFLKELVTLVRPKSELSDEVKKKLESLEEERSSAYQSKMFEREFEEKILPLLEKDSISEENRNKIKKLLKKLAFTTDYAQTPLPVIYRGVEEFDRFRAKGKKSAESSRGGMSGGVGEEKDIREMTDEEFEKFSDEQGSKQSEKTYQFPE